MQVLDPRPCREHSTNSTSFSHSEPIDYTHKGLNGGVRGAGPFRFLLAYNLHKVSHEYEEVRCADMEPVYV